MQFIERRKLEWVEWHKKKKKKKYSPDKTFKAVARWIDELDERKNNENGLDNRVVTISSVQMVLGSEEKTE